MSPSLFAASQFLSIQDGRRVEDVAERSRRAATAFVNGASAGWTPRDVAAWFAGPYRRAASGATATTTLDAWTADELTGTDRFARELAATRASVLATVRRLGTMPARDAFVDEAIDSGLVAPCVLAAETTWIASWTPDAELHKLVAALFVVDYLARPLSFRDALTVCSTCQAVLFDAGGRARGGCAIHDAPPAPRALSRRETVRMAAKPFPPRHVTVTLEALRLA
jgi:hypothetical protein